mgnify:CR=1 FL=1
MRLYHGTNIDFSEIDLAKSFPLKESRLCVLFAQERV